MAIPVLRTELFDRYGLDWELGIPPEPGARPATADTDLSRFFATDDRSASAQTSEGSADDRPTEPSDV